MAAVEAAAVRRLCVVLFAFLFALPLVAVGPAPSLLGTPTLLVYPFAVNGSDVSREAGARLAVTIATQIANLGGVNVKPAPPGIDRHDYLSAALAEHVDYYIAGYVTPLGDGVSLVEQLVSTQTGIVVFSNTAQVRSYTDATGQGDVLREALLRHQTRNLGAYAAPPPPAGTAAPTSAPGGAQANLGRLFGRKQKRSAAPAPTAAPSAPPNAVAQTSAAPAPAGTQRAATPATRRATGYGLLTIGGPAENERRAFTGAAIRNVLIANHQRVAGGSAPNASACSDSAVGTLVGGNLSTRNHTLLGEHQTFASLEFLAYDCTGSVVYRQTFAQDARGGWRDAVDRVVHSAVAAFLHSPSGQPG